MEMEMKKKEPTVKINKWTMGLLAEGLITIESIVSGEKAKLKNENTNTNTTPETN